MGCGCLKKGQTINIIANDNINSPFIQICKNGNDEYICGENGSK